MGRRKNEKVCRWKVKSEFLTRRQHDTHQDQQANYSPCIKVPQLERISEEDSNESTDSSSMIYQRSCHIEHNVSEHCESSVQSTGKPEDRSSRSRVRKRVAQRVRVLKEINKLQKSVKMLIPRISFCRLVREVLAQLNDTNMRIQSDALAAIQEATEMYLVQLLQDAYCCSLHARRVTLLKRDMQLIRKLRGNWDLLRM